MVNAVRTCAGISGEMLHTAPSIGSGGEAGHNTAEKIQSREHTAVQQVSYTVHQWPLWEMTFLLGWVVYSKYYFTAQITSLNKGRWLIFVNV